MEHRVKFAPDDLMPSGRNWVLCRKAGVTTLYLRQSSRAWSEDRFTALLEAAWEGYRGLAECDGTVIVPVQRAYIPAHVG